MGEPASARVLAAFHRHVLLPPWPGALASPGGKTLLNPTAPTRYRAPWPTAARAARQSAGPTAPAGPFHLRSSILPCASPRAPIREPRLAAEPTRPPAGSRRT